MLIIQPDPQNAKKLSRLQRAGRLDSPQMGKAFATIGLSVQGVAFNYAPISPDKRQYVATLKGNETKRNDFTSGELRKSITHEVIGNTAVDIFVPSNSGAGDYAAKIHDERGKSWHDRGVGTIAKGEQAREKFIARAIDDQTKEIAEELAVGISNTFKGI